MKCWILQILPVWKLSSKEPQLNEPFPSACLLEVISTPADPCSLQEQTETDRLGFTCPGEKKNRIYVLGSFLQAWWWYWHLMKGLVFFPFCSLGSQSCVMRVDPGPVLYSGQVLCMPPLNYRTSRPWRITIPWSAFLLKSAAWKHWTLRSELLGFSCSS